MNNSTDNSPVGSVIDQSFTLNTTPTPEDEAMRGVGNAALEQDNIEVKLQKDVETSHPPLAKPSARKKSALDQLLLDHDWYITFEQDSRRLTSIKRQEEKMMGLVQNSVVSGSVELTEEEKEERRRKLEESQLKRKQTRERNLLLKMEKLARRRLQLEKLKQQRLAMSELGQIEAVSLSKAANLKDLLEGASWFNRDADLDTYTRKFKPQTERFIIEDETPVRKRPKKVSNKVKMEDSVLVSRGKTNGLTGAPVEKKKLVKKVTKVKKEKQNGTVNDVNDVEMVEEVEVVETVDSETSEPRFNWFFDLSNTISVESRQLFIDEIYQNQSIAVDFSQLDDSSEEYLVSLAQLVLHFEKNYVNNDQFPYKEVSLCNLFSNYREKYILSLPKDGGLDPYIEIGTYMELVLVLYLPEKHRLTLRNEENPQLSIVGRYIRLYLERDFATLVLEIDNFNKFVQDLKQNQDSWLEICQYLQNLKSIPRLVFHEILNQCYSRTVSPNVRSLRSYKLFSNEVYGELLPSFLSTVYDKTGLSHEMTFIDLGSGVGNCVLQLLLEYGCDSYGCEVMGNASKLSALQLVEFNKRCKFVFGFKTGQVGNFLNQSFVNNELVTSVVNRCKVILCNNYLFDADLNAKCVELFRNLQTGTKIITLKPLVPLGYSFDAQDVESILNRIKVEKCSYGNNSVSWTNNGGTYYVNHVQQDIVSEYFVERAKGRTSRTRLRR